MEAAKTILDDLEDFMGGPGNVELFAVRRGMSAPELVEGIQFAASLAGLDENLAALAAEISDDDLDRFL